MIFCYFGLLYCIVLNIYIFNSFIFINFKNKFMRKITLFLAALLISMTAFAQAITATWSVTEGATLESFSEVTITFSDVTAVKAKSTYSCFWFYEKATDGNWQLVSNMCTAGYMDASASGTSLTLGVDPGCYSDDFTSPFSRKGEYRIVIPAGGVFFNGDNTNLNTEEYVLNFVINNGKVEPQEVNADYTVVPAQDLLVEEIREIELTFTEYDSIVVAEPDLTMGSNIPTVYIEDDLMGALMPAGYIMAKPGKTANSLSLYVDPQYGGVEAFVREGKYQINIPSKLVAFDATSVNSAITLKYEVKALASTPAETTSMDVVKQNPGRRILYKGLEPAAVTVGSGWMSYTEYFMPDSTTVLNYQGYVIPAKMDVYGTYYPSYAPDQWTEPAPTFVVDSVAAISSFNTIGDLVNFVESEATTAQKTLAYDVKDPIVVTLPGTMNLYAQYESESWGGATWNGINLQLSMMATLDFQPKAGDAISVKGVYNPAVYDETGEVLQTPAFFALETATLVSENNKLNYTAYEVKSGFSNMIYSPATLMRLTKGGKVVADTDEFGSSYYLVVEYQDYVMNEETGMYDEVMKADSLRLQQASANGDPSAYVGKELDVLIAGVADFDVYTQKPVFYVTEFQEAKIFYDNIAEMIAAGSQSDYTMSSVLKNPVVVNYISYNQWAGYTLFIEDATGAIAVKGVGEMDEDEKYTFPYNIAVGDSIVGVEGFVDLSQPAAFMWTGADYGVKQNYEKVATGRITPLDITLAELSADVVEIRNAMDMGNFYLSKYANKVVRVKNLGDKYVDPYDEKWPWYTQKGTTDSIQFSTYYWGSIAMPDNMEVLIGIVDYMIINGQTASIQPLDAMSVIEKLAEAKNAYAYDVKVEKREETVAVSYSLNAPAEYVRVLAYANDEVVAVKNAPAAAFYDGEDMVNTHVVEFAIAELPKKEITFEVEVTGDIVTVPTQVAKNYQFYHPKGVEVDANPESEFFGRIYATEGMPVAKAGDKYISDTNGNGVGQGLYAFDAALNPIANKDGKYGFTGGLTFNNLNPAGKSDYSPLRVVLSDDGRLFFSRQSVGVSPLVEVNPADLDANFTEVFTGFVCDSTTYDLNTADGAFMAAPNVGFDVKGSGEDLQVLMLSTKASGWSAAKAAFRVDEYNLGTATTWSAAPSTAVEALSGKYIVTYTSSNVEYDNEGGMWLIQHRGTPSASEPALVHLNAAGEVDYTNTSINAAASGFAFNADYTLLAFAGNGNKKCTIYAVGKDENGAPTLTEKYTFETTIGTNLNDIAWDYADNLYIVGNSGEYLKVFALPRESAVVTTPAAKRYAVDLGLPMEVEFANIAAIYEAGMWDMEYYKEYAQNEVKAVLKSQPTVVDVVVSSGMMGGSINNYYLNDGTGVIVLRAEGDMYQPIMDEETWDTIAGLNIAIGKKLPADFTAAIDFKCVVDDETWLPTGEVYGAPVMTYVPKLTGDVIVDEYGLETEITETNDEFIARCEDSDFVEEAVEVESLAKVHENRIAYAGKLLAVKDSANYYAESMMDHFSGSVKTTAYMFWNAEEAFEIEEYTEEDVTTVFVTPKYTEDYNNYAAPLFNLMTADSLPAATLTQEATIAVAKVRFDWNSVAACQSLILKEGYAIDLNEVIDNVENTELNVNIYSNNGSVYVETEAGAMIEVYTVNGLRVYAGVSNTTTTIINGLNTNIAIIRVNGTAYKVFVK